MTAALAAAPLLVVVLVMGALRQSAAIAGAAAFIVALALALTVFELTRGAAADLTRFQVVTGALAEAGHATATILWIIFPAIAIYELQQRTGAFDRIRDALVALSDDRGIQAVLIAWFFGLFAEGAAGFGTPVALAAPLLVGIGFTPVRAVALALIGHAAGVSFGAIGTPVFAQAEVTGLPAAQIATATAVLHALLGIVLIAFLARLAGGSFTRAGLMWPALAAVFFFIPYLLLGMFAGPELPALGGALIGGLAYVAVLRRARPGEARSVALGRLLFDFSPYLIIVGLVLATRLIPPLEASLTSITLDWSLHGIYEETFEPLYHPGTILLLGFVGGALLTGHASQIGPAAVAAIRRLLFVALTLLAMLAMSRLMVHSGMIETLATTAAQAGPLWPFLAPAIGVLGTFVTGSATASNVLFSEFQVKTATGASLPELEIVAGQGFGAAAGNMIAPHNIIAGAATVGVKGEEGRILAQTSGACAVYGAAGGVALFIWIAFQPAE